MTISYVTPRKRLTRITHALLSTVRTEGSTEFKVGHEEVCYFISSGAGTRFP